MAQAKSLREHRVVRADIQVESMHRLAVYTAHGGYQALRKAVSEMTPDQVIAELAESGLGGRGGAGFPTGSKWRMVASAGGDAVVAANGDESEPGAFKDRELMESLPHRVLEGALIAAYAVRATELFLFVRGEYERAQQRLSAAVEEAREAGLTRLGGPLQIHLHWSAGAYICGEETALIESLEGNRPMPRVRPPYPAVSGYQGRPTLVNNVETLATVPAIVLHGAGTYRAVGTPEEPGTRVFSLSGNVLRPGNYELPLGTPLSALIEQLGGGVPDGRAIKAVIPGGTSAPLLMPDQLHVPLTAGAMRAIGSNLGTASVIVYDDRHCMVDLATNMSLFYRDESCGKCTPCRDGTHFLHEILARIESGLGQPEDLEQLRTICGYLPDGSICALGSGAVSPVTATLAHFLPEYQAHIDQHHCPVRRHFEVSGECFPVVQPPPDPGTTGGG